MTDQIALWHRDHIGFLQLLDVLEGQLNIFLDAGQPDYALMVDVMYYMIEYPDRFHHPKEDVAFARLMEVDKGAKPLVMELLAQHELIAKSGKSLFKQLDGIMAGAMMTRESVSLSARDYIFLMKSHLNLEETQLFPMALKILRHEDWLAVDAAITPPEDPLFGGQVQKRFEALHKQIARQAECGCEE